MCVGHRLFTITKARVDRLWGEPCSRVDWLFLFEQGFKQFPFPGSEMLEEGWAGDAESVGEFFSLLSELNSDGMSILLVEHDIEAVIEYTERVLCLNRELYFDVLADAFPGSDGLERAYGITTGERAGVTR